MQSLLIAVQDISLSHDTTVLSAGVDVITGVRPNWGPFAKLGKTAKILLGVAAAVSLVAAAGSFILGLAKSRGWVGEGHSTLETSRGKGMMVGGLVGVFLIASIGTLFTVTYRMGV